MLKDKTEPFLLYGGRAFSDFRLKTLLDNLKFLSSDTDVCGVEADYVYFLQCARKPDEQTLSRAMLLLDARSEGGQGGGFYVTPRKGTISPWSSKATDIFHNCGLDSAARVERGIHFRVCNSSGDVLSARQLGPALSVLHDRMTEGVYEDISDIFERMEPVPLRVVDISTGGREAIVRANQEMGLALNDDEIDYLYGAYGAVGRNPTDVELVMFGQVNSEHCRHKIFNAEWVIDGERMPHSLFDMIRNTHAAHPEGTIIAYEDNSAVIEGWEAEWFEAERGGSNVYRYAGDRVEMLMKVETHNHPTAISPYPGAATGIGGEIRDETATGIGGKSKAGMSAFMVSNLRIPGFLMPWEKEHAPFPERLASPLDIMIEGPIGGAGFGNEYGRPQLLGLFRTYEDMVGDKYRGYHKPIMVAGGMGNIKRRHCAKKSITEGARIIQIGGPAMRIGLGGGAASSLAAGSNVEALDFDSVQRGNAEMERRCQEVIEACIALGEDNPILSIHDLGAGGLSNGCPELVAETGATFELREIPNEDFSMSPMEIWCCEAQERYVLSIQPSNLDRFLRICGRERCPVAVIGEATGDGHLRLSDRRFDNLPIDVDIGLILGKPPKMTREVSCRPAQVRPLEMRQVNLKEAAYRVLRAPAVADKTFLITIADRSVTGLVARDQMTGPYQVPVSDVAVTASSFRSCRGEAMAVGERTPIALISPASSGRMAIGEAITNIAPACIGEIGKIKLSANWMCACGSDGEDAGLYETVKAVGMELCPELGISIPVGKDSLSMKTVWAGQGGAEHKMTAPLSLVVTAFAPVSNVRKTVTPELKESDSVLMLVDLGGGRNRLGGSILAQVFNQVGDQAPDLEDPVRFAAFFNAVQELLGKDLLCAYHDRSDGGLFAALAEMAFAARKGIQLSLDCRSSDALAALFSEELGAVLQVEKAKAEEVSGILSRHGLEDAVSTLGNPVSDGRFRVTAQGETILDEDLADLNRAWSEMSFRLQSLRDNPECAKEEYDSILDRDDPGLSCQLSFDPFEAPTVSGAKPRLAVLREQGINGHVEMAAAFDTAGFECVDVHMTDLHEGRVLLSEFAGLVACGGFSYGDVLGAGSGWAKSILFNERLKDMFAEFFARPDSFTLGVCNGCQMVSQLKDIIPGAEDWPAFTRNRSEQFEARFSTVEIMPSPSVLLRDMQGSRLAIPVAHGEGRADFGQTGAMAKIEQSGLASMRYVDNRGNPTERYPFNPNGSPGGITGLTSNDGRVTIMMPHPERGFRSVQMSYRPGGMFRGEPGPWLKLFRNARVFADES